MGIPGLINAIGAGERVSLSKLAVSHLERTARPIRVAVDISIWLFQVQAGRGGKNPELRTLFYRLLKLLALPIHPLFVYDGQQKPPFKRGKAVSARSYGNAPIIRRSKDLIERFRFPWHEAPGEAEAECARLQQAGIVDAVMSNDVDALMFGSSLTILNFSKESGSGTSAATHVTCYRMGNETQTSNVPLNRAGMILFALLSGADYLPSGVPKCGSKLAAEIAKAGFGEDLLQELTSQSPDLGSRLSEWRERLQYELEENESGYFATKHKAVRIPDSFPDQIILKFYAEPAVSTEEEMAALKCRLKHEWDRDIDPVAIRSFAAENFEWNYRSGARKVIKLLAEPLVSYRLRLQRPVSGVSQGSLAPDCDVPWMQKVYRSRASFATDGLTELQMDILPIDVVGLDLLAEEPNPPLPSQETMPSQTIDRSGDEEDDAELAVEVAPSTPSKSRVTKRFDPFSIGKLWVFETVAKLGVPDAVNNWEHEQADKAKKTATKKSATRRSGPKKKGPIDPGMKRGSILKYGTLTKEKSELLSSSKTHILEAAAGKDRVSQLRASPAVAEHTINLQNPFSPSMYTQKSPSSRMPSSSHDVDELIDNFSSLNTTSPIPLSKHHPLARQLLTRARVGILTTERAEIDALRWPNEDDENDVVPIANRDFKLRYSISNDDPSATRSSTKSYASLSKFSGTHRCRKHKGTSTQSDVIGEAEAVEDLEKAIDSLSLLTGDNAISQSSTPPRLLSREPKLKPLPRPCQMVNIEHHGLLEQHGTSNSLLVNQPSSPSERNQRSHTSNTVKISDDESIIDKPKLKPDSRHAQSKTHGLGTRETIGHVENITTSDGFWCTENTHGSEMLFTSSCAWQPGDSEGSRDKQTRTGRKRVARVSILDMV